MLFVRRKKRIWIIGSLYGLAAHDVFVTHCPWKTGLVYFTLCKTSDVLTEMYSFFFFFWKSFYFPSRCKKHVTEWKGRRIIVCGSSIQTLISSVIKVFFIWRMNELSVSIQDGVKEQVRWFVC